MAQLEFETLEAVTGAFGARPWTRMPEFNMLPTTNTLIISFSELPLRVGLHAKSFKCIHSLKETLISWMEPHQTQNFPRSRQSRSSAGAGDHSEDWKCQGVPGSERRTLRKGAPRCATDHNMDNTTEMLQEWLAAVGSDYAAVFWRPEGESRSYPSEEGPKHWTKERHQFLMELKQEALTFARNWGADYVLFADTDNILTNNQTLRLLVEKGLPVVAPMLDSQTYYSNFWCGITPQGYYRRTAEYFPTKNRQRRGCFRVPMVHSTFLLSLRAEGISQFAFYPPHPNYTWPFDDIIVFAYACQAAGVSVHVCNEQRYGYMNVGVKSHQTLEDEKVNFIHLILEALVDGPPMQASAHVSRPPKRPSKMGFDEVFVISLARRPNRRERMLSSLWEMEISGRVVDAVDGRMLNSSILRSLGVDLLPGYQDPYSGRTLTKGEVGCFLSHYSIWEESQLTICWVLADILSRNTQNKKKAHLSPSCQRGICLELRDQRWAQNSRKNQTRRGEKRRLSPQCSGPVCCPGCHVGRRQSETVAKVQRKQGLFRNRDRKAQGVALLIPWPRGLSQGSGGWALQSPATVCRFSPCFYFHLF
uniref:inactive glycosyltransferase 25 family member 3 isoform X2 n=1 Tax=Ictidomys tridecemlineatus TaxID=43179 RepID=UPI001A9FFE79|nr:inactive glycosyltransferase 25 family member 3 isoform X2 [Ictidomys tridecemlineatus]